MVYFFFFFCPENVSYFLHESYFACHLGAPSGTLLSPDIKPTYLAYGTWKICQQFLVCCTDIQIFLFVFIF